MHEYEDIYIGQLVVPEEPYWPLLAMVSIFESLIFFWLEKDKF
jgi:hypothetical protein